MAEQPPASARERPWPAVGALVVCTVALGLLLGPVGALAGLVTAAVWYGLGVPYALAAGHVVLVAATPDRLAPSTIVLVELAFLTLPVASVSRTPAPLVAGGVVIGAGAGLGALAWASYASRGPWIAAVVLLGTIALVAYGVHRYELVRLGLVTEVGDEHPPTTRNDP